MNRGHLSCIEFHFCHRKNFSQLDLFLKNDVLLIAYTGKVLALLLPKCLYKKLYTLSTITRKVMKIKPAPIHLAWLYNPTTSKVCDSFYMALIPYNFKTLLFLLYVFLFPQLQNFVNHPHKNFFD